MGTKKARSNFTDPNFNPCIEEGILSSNCMKENLYDPNKCSFYFENYRNCKKFWRSVQNLRMRHKIEPFIPELEEREKILKEREKGNYVYEVKNV